MDDDKKQSLAKELKGRLRITWEDDRTDMEISQIIDDTGSYMNHLLGAEADYTAPGINHMLFIAYAMYLWNNCENEFEAAYLKDINRARAVNEVKYEQENPGSE